MPSSCIVPMMENTSCTSTGDRTMDGSSMTMSFGALMIARPMASICCSPPESVPASCFARSFRRGKRA